MPIRYALERDYLTPRTETETSALTAQGYNKLELQHDYDPVPQQTAEMHDNGRYALFSETGTKLSDWLPLIPSQAVTTARESASKKQKKMQALDSALQEVFPGDYIMFDNEDRDRLLLGKVIRTTKAQVEFEQLTDHHTVEGMPRKRNLNQLIKIPTAMVEGGGLVEPMVLEKKFAIQHTVFPDYNNFFVSKEKVEAVEESLLDAAPPFMFFNPLMQRYLERRWHGSYGAYYEFVSEEKANEGETGRLGYMNDRGFIISGLLSLKPGDHTQYSLNRKAYGHQKLVDSLDVPLTDAFGADIQVGDYIFTGRRKEFSLHKVVGFTKNKVQALGYVLDREEGFNGNYVLCTLPPNRMVKLPVIVTE